MPISLNSPNFRDKIGLRATTDAGAVDGAIDQQSVILRCAARHVMGITYLYFMNLMHGARIETVEREDPSASPIRGEAANDVLFIDKPPGSRKVLLKICKVILRYGD